MSHYDVLVIGSGFGGSVTALRLTEKGYRVGVLEAGRRFTADTLPKNSWRLRNFLWAPKLGCTGIQRIHVLKDCLILAGAGRRRRVAELREHPLRAAAAVLRRPAVGAHHRLARRAGAALRPGQEDARRRHQPDRPRPATSRCSGWPSSSARPTPTTRRRSACSSAATAQQEPGKTVPDPFFGGAGPERTGCIQCGECMTGCRHGAKNTLTTNYLYLAEKQRRRDPPADHGDRRPAAQRRRLRGRTTAHRALVRRTRPHLHRRPGRVLGRHLQHPEAAAPAARATPAEHLDAAGLPHPHQLRGAARRAAAPSRSTTTPRASRSPRPGTRTRTRTSSRAATARAATRWAC